MKLYLDEDISPKVAVVLRKKGLDTVSAHEISMLEASDEQQLSFAADEQRAMVTRNRDDFITLTVRFFIDLKPHHELIIAPHTIQGYQFSTLASLLVKFSKNYTHDMEPYTIEFLPCNYQSDMFKLKFVRTGCFSVGGELLNRPPVSLKRNFAPKMNRLRLK